MAFSEELAASGDPRGLIMRAWALWEHVESADDQESAKELLRNVMSESGAVADSAAGTLGVWEYEEGNFLTAEPLLRRGFEFFEWARTDLAQLLLSRGENDEAVDILEAGIAAGERDCAPLYANYLQETGDIPRAVEILREASAAGDTNAAWNLYRLLSDDGREKDGEPYFWQAVRGGDKFALAELNRINEDETETDD